MFGDNGQDKGEEEYIDDVEEEKLEEEVL